jgi:hypothetical protein
MGRMFRVTVSTLGAMYLWANSLSLTVSAQSDEELGTAVCTGGLWLGLLALNIAILFWVLSDAKARGASGCAWAIIVLFTGVVGLLVYLVARPTGVLVPCPECGKRKPIVSAICPHCGRRVV